MIIDGESKNVEYKQEYTKSILKTVCAYANFHDGTIAIGIKDNGTIIGVDNIDELKLNIENAINDAIIPKPYYEFEINMVDECQILLINVNKGDHTPYTYQNKSYMRRDTSTVQTDMVMNQNLILAGRNLGYEDLPSSVQALSFTYFELLMRKQIQITSLTEDLMRTLGLFQNNGYNNAAALLSNENPMDSSILQMVAFSDNGVGRINDRVTLTSCSILEQFDECMNFYKKHINVGEIIEVAYRKTVEDVPYIAYREAVANMLVHRDYSIAVAARIEFFSDRVEVVSPGGLPIGLSKEEYLEGRISKARNPKISDVFLRLKIIEKLATGIRRIKEQYIDQELKPRFMVSENSVVVVLPFVSESSRRHNLKVQNNESFLEGNERQIYEFIMNSPGIKRADIQGQIGLEKSQTIELLNRLRESGRIIKVGNGPSTGYKIIG